MKIGCPTEIKTREYRVGMTPATCREAIAHGHEVMVQSGAGFGAGFPDEDYEAVGVRIVGGAEQIFAETDMIVKVKEPQPGERRKSVSAVSVIKNRTWAYCCAPICRPPDPLTSE